MYRRVYHAPWGDPCVRRVNNIPCGLPAVRHRVDHNPEGDPCTRLVSESRVCGLAAEKHYRKFGHRTYDERKYFAGIDGEGQGRDDHKYVMLAWCNEDGSHRNAIEAKEGERLTTVQCLDFILSVPLNARLFSFAFSYDLTKILTDIDDELLYRLFRPELRQRKKKDDQKKGPIPVYWEGYQLNLMGSKFTVAKDGRRHIIWDVFKFFQAKFTSALEDWFSRECEPGTPGAIEDDKTKTGWRLWTPPEMGRAIEHMRRMKDKRAEFDRLTRKEILDYCYEECADMARLAHKLNDAHEKAGLHLKAYHGAGSTASAILKEMGIDKAVREVKTVLVRRKPVDYSKLAQSTRDDIRLAIASGFFGGRFENLVIGDIPGPIWGYDISSAYPYQTTFLPCLACGQWERTRNRKDRKSVV